MDQNLAIKKIKREGKKTIESKIRTNNSKNEND